MGLADQQAHPLQVARLEGVVAAAQIRDGNIEAVSDLVADVLGDGDRDEESAIVFVAAVVDQHRVLEQLPSRTQVVLRRRLDDLGWFTTSGRVIPGRIPTLIVGLVESLGVALN